MNFDTLVDRLTSLYDVAQARAVDVSNERLQRMCAASEFIRVLRTLAVTTVNGQAAYALDTDIVQVYRVRVTYASGLVIYAGTESLDAFWDLETGAVVAPDCGHWYVMEPDTDGSGTTTNIRFYPAPGETGVAIKCLSAVIPAALTYGSTSALPIPLDCHEHLLAGCKAELADEESTDSSKFEAVFEAGVKRLEKRVTSRGTGSDGHRMRMAGYDFSR